MIYRLVSVWRDTEESNSPVMRAARDFSTDQDAEAWVSSIALAGVARFDIRAERMENGARLLATLVPIGRIVGWFIWELPDDTPEWPVGEMHSG
jgi:hypothetical protein